MLLCAPPPPPVQDTVHYMKKEVAACVGTLVFIAAIIFLTIYLHRPPAASSATAPPTDFSSARALQHLKVIAVAPRAVGTPAHDAARDYIMQHLAALGVNPEIQVAVRTLRRFDSPVTLRNITARLAGSGGGGKAILLVAHYDTVPSSPGANDDGSGVATLLETFRALKAGPPLENDVLFLFSDGEEMGLLGARGFIAENQAFQDVGLVLNFEARGTGGPVYMFETGDGNNRLIKEFGEAVPYPYTSSLMGSIYRMLPNSTDFTVFKDAGRPGFNFAYIDGAEHYHTANDTLDHLDERSLQHHGSYALALTRHFGGLNLEQERTNDAVYFDLLGTTLISYTEKLVRPLALILALLFIGMFIFGHKNGQLSLIPSALGFVGFSAHAACCAMLATFICLAFSAAFGANTLHREAVPILVGLVAINLSLTSLVYQSLARRISFNNLTAGMLFCWLAVTIAASIFSPEASYLLQWPLLFSCSAFVLNTYLQSSNANWLLRPVVTCLSLVPGLVLLIWTGLGVFEGVRLMWPLLTSIFILLLIGLLIPGMEFLLKPDRRIISFSFLFISLIAFTIAIV